MGEGFPPPRPGDGGTPGVACGRGSGRGAGHGTRLAAPEQCPSSSPDIKMVFGLISLGHKVKDAPILLIYQKVNAILILYSHGIVFKFPPPRSSSRIV